MGGRERENSRFREGGGRDQKQSQRDDHHKSAYAIHSLVNSQKLLTLQGSPSLQPQPEIPALSHSIPQIYHTYTFLPQYLNVLPIQEHLVWNWETNLPARVGATFPGFHGAFMFLFYCLVY